MAAAIAAAAPFLAAVPCSNTLRIDFDGRLRVERWVGRSDDESSLEDAELSTALWCCTPSALVLEIDMPLLAMLRAGDLAASVRVSVRGLPYAILVLASLILHVDVVGASVRGAEEWNTAPAPKQARLLAAVHHARRTQATHNVAGLFMP